MSEPATPAPATPAPATPEPPAAAPARQTSGRRRGLAVIALVLACVTILMSTVAVWTHQVAFNTDRFTALVTNVVGDPAIIAPLSSRISTQVVEAVGLEARIADTLPGPSKVLAPAMTNAVREAIDKRLQVALANPRVQKALLTTVSFTHERVMRLLRGESDAITVIDGYVYMSAFPVVGTALNELQSMGLIPAGVQLPDLSSPEAPEALAGKLEAALGVTLPADFGMIQLMPADRLIAAQSAVRMFDVLVVLLLLLTAFLVGLALWLATSRRKMLLALGIGTVIAFLLARLAMNGVRNILIEGITDADLAGAVRALMDATLTDLRGLTAIILFATIMLVIAAYLWGRPAWAVRTSRAAVGAASGAAAGASSQLEGVASRESLATTARVQRVRIERVGLVAIAFGVLWIAVSLEVAMLGLALVVGLELIVRALGRGSDTDGTDDAAPEPALEPVPEPDKTISG